VSSHDRRPGYPRQLPGPTAGGGAKWTLVEGSSAPRPREDGAPDSAEDADVPRYALSPGGTLGTPTGLVFLRLAEGLDVAAWADELAAAGYRIARRPEWAKNAAWVAATSGRVADALSGIERLAALPGVASVEAQLHSERGTR
jgi:hypothetical protein